jgi:hypothetical protein
VEALPVNLRHRRSKRYAASLQVATDNELADAADAATIRAGRGDIYV